MEAENDSRAKPRGPRTRTFGTKKTRTPLRVPMLATFAPSRTRATFLRSMLVVAFSATLSLTNPKPRSRWSSPRSSSRASARLTLARVVTSRYHSVMKTKSCKLCGSPFQTGKWRIRYCSKECRVKGYAQGAVAMKCKVCRAIYYTHDSRLGRSKYCSKECQHKSMVLPRGKCRLCKRPIVPTKTNPHATFCNRTCSSRWTAKHRPTTKYRVKTYHGYILVRRPEHPQATKRGYIMEHRLVMEKMIGRHLEKGEVVHHKNKNKSDNRKRNLELMTKYQHDCLPKPKNPLVCPKCGHTIARTKYAQRAEPIC